MLDSVPLFLLFRSRTISRSQPKQKHQHCGRPVCTVDRSTKKFCEQPRKSSHKPEDPRQFSVRLHWFVRGRIQCETGWVHRLCPSVSVLSWISTDLHAGRTQCEAGAPHAGGWTQRAEMDASLSGAPISSANTNPPFTYVSICVVAGLGGV